MFNDDSSDFITATQQARRVPDEDPMGVSREIPLPAIFETEDAAEQRNNSYLKKEVNPSKLGLELFVIFHSSVYVLYRPWEKCDRCATQIRAAQGKTVLIPTDAGDYVCPHTHKSDYDLTVNQSLTGDVVITFKEHSMTPDGIRRVHLEWLTPDPDKKREIERRLKAKKEE
jgi:hypothetical protein